MTPLVRRFVCEIERCRLDENVEARPVVWEAWRAPEPAHAGYLDSKTEHIRAYRAMRINTKLIHAWKCLTRCGPLRTVLLLAAFAVLGSGQRNCRQGELP